jgi:hypothetical protein
MLSGLDHELLPYQSKAGAMQAPALGWSRSPGHTGPRGLKKRPEARFAGYRVAGGCCAGATSPTQARQEEAREWQSGLTAPEDTVAPEQLAELARHLREQDGASPAEVVAHDSRG